MTKKILSMLLAVSMVLSLFAIPVAAEGDTPVLSITATDVDSQPITTIASSTEDQQITILVKLENPAEKEIAGGNFTVKSENENIAFTDYVITDKFSLKTFNPSNGKFMVTSSTCTDASIDLLKVTATLKANAPAGAYVINVTDTKFVDPGKQNLGVAGSSLTINVVNEISSVAITDVTAPAKGEAPVKSVTAPESVEASIKWTTEDGADFAGSVFAKETVYKAVITVAPKADYVFASNVAFTLDGKTVDAEKNGDNYVITTTFPATGSANTLLGKVALSNEAPTYGDTITATATPEYNGEPDGELSYRWYRGGVAIDGATNAAYTAGKSDVGQVLTVKVKSSTNSGEIEASTAAVAKKTLTVTGLDVTIKEYDGTKNATITGGTLADVFEGDTVTVSATGEFASSNAGENIQVSADATLGGADAAYYTVEQPTGLTGTITTRKITVTADDKTVRVGATELPALTYKVTSGSLVEGETLTGALATDATTDVEQDFDIVQGTLEATSNYDLTFVKGTLSVVNKATQTITIEDVAAKTYGDDAFTLTVNPDKTSNLTAFVYASSNPKVATVDEYGKVTIVGAGEVTITVNEPGDNDYAPAKATVSFKVAKKTLAVEGLVAVNRAYNKMVEVKIDRTDAQLIGLAARDASDGAMISYGMPTVGCVDDANVGKDKIVKAYVDIKGESVNNYVVTEVDGSYAIPVELTVDITPAPITIVVKDASIKAGTAEPTFDTKSYEIEGDVYDELTVTLTAPSYSKDAAVDSTHTIKAAIDNANYTATVKEGTLTVIDKDPQTITIEDVATKTYGGEPFALVVETNASAESPAMTFASDNEKVVTVDEKGLVTIVGAGKANITVGAAATENFAAATAKVEVVVAPKEIEVLEVDWNTDPKIADFIGVINDDDVDLDFDKVKTTVISSTIVGDTVTTSFEIYNFKLTGEDAGNYVVVTEKLQDIKQSTVKTVTDEAGVDVKVSTAGNTVLVSDIDTQNAAGEVTKVTIDAATEVATASAVEIPVDKVNTVTEASVDLEIKLKDKIEVTFNNDALVEIKGKATEVNASAKVSVSVNIVEKDELQVAQKDKVEAVSEKSPVVYSLSVKADGTAIAGEGTGFGTGGKAIVKLPYVKPEGNGNIIVKYIRKNGEEVVVPNPIYDEINKLVRAELGHFSEYLVYTEPYVYIGGGGGSSTYTVRFNSNGGSAVKSISVKKNGTVTEPTAPTKEGYEFAGWYTDSALTKAYDFSTAVTKTITLYAKWNEVEKDPEDDKPGTDEPVIDEPATGITFSDVKANDWFYDSVKFVVDNKLMNGVSATNFAPNDSLTRAMLVTILFRNEGEVAVNKSIPFSDVDMGSYYAEAVIWAKQHGIVNGATENEFAPDANITREQIAAIMHRYAQYKGFDVTVGETADITSYTDAAAVSEYAVDAMKYVVGSGLINGKTATTLNPADNATRAEIAAILQRFITNNSK